MFGPAQQAAAADARACPTCAHPNAPDANFCSRCGGDLHAAPALDVVLGGDTTAAPLDGPAYEATAAAPLDGPDVDATTAAPLVDAEPAASTPDPEAAAMAVTSEAGAPGALAAATGAAAAASPAVVRATLQRNRGKVPVAPVQLFTSDDGGPTRRRGRLTPLRALTAALVLGGCVAAYLLPESAEFDDFVAASPAPVASPVATPVSPPVGPAVAGGPPATIEVVPAASAVAIVPAAVAPAKGAVVKTARPVKPGPAAESGESVKLPAASMAVPAGTNPSAARPPVGGAPATAVAAVATSGPAAASAVTSKASSPATAEPARPTVLDWYAALHHDLAQCDGMSLIRRTLCEEKAKWRHCEPGRRWGTVPECVKPAKPTPEY